MDIWFLQIQTKLGACKYPPVGRNLSKQIGFGLGFLKNSGMGWKYCSKDSCLEVCLGLQALLLFRGHKSRAFGLVGL